MIQNLRNSLFQQFRLFACMLALFFVVLAVFDGFEVQEEIEYVGHFLDEADFDYVDFPTTISRPSSNPTLKVQRVELVRIYDFFLSVIRFEIKPVQCLEYIPITVFSGLDILIGKSISTNAP